MSKGVKTVIGVVAAIAIPFVAPAIASAIGTSMGISAATFGMSATVGKVLGSAAVGAVLGGVTQKALGGNFAQGALMGAIGGGIGGYMNAPSAAPSAARVADPAAYTLSAPPTTAGVDLYPGNPAWQSFGEPSLATGGFADPVVQGFTPDYSLTSGVQFPTSLNPSTSRIGFQAVNPGFSDAATAQALAAGTPVDYSLAAGMPPSVGFRAVSANPITGGTQVVTPTGTFQSTTPISQYSGGSSAAANATPSTFTQAIAKVPGEIAAKFTDPKMLADMTLRAAGNLAGSALAGDGLSDAERALLNAQTEELRTLQQTNADLFRQRLEYAQNLIGESKYFDPEYFGLQRARRVQTAAARAKHAGLRGLEGEKRAAEARRFDLATARDTGTAYDQGYLTGVQGRLDTMKAGVGLLPTSYPSSTAEYTNLYNVHDKASKRARETQEDIGSLFGSLLGTQKAQSRGY